MVSHGLAQSLRSHHRRILLRALKHRARRRLQKRWRLQSFWKALPEIDRPMLYRKTRHHFENGGAIAGKHRIG